jgi:predicted small secreted protein
LFLTAQGQKTKENDMKKITLLSLLVLVLMTSLFGCNAARGAGKDLEDTGKHIENIGK